MDDDAGVITVCVVWCHCMVYLFVDMCFGDGIGQGLGAQSSCDVNETNAGFLMNVYINLPLRQQMQYSEALTNESCC